MLITLKSSAEDGNANRFTNYFKEGIIIKPNSEIGLVNASYAIQEGFVITTGVNDRFTMSLAPFNQETDILIPPGDYATLADLATAITAAIHTYIGNQGFITEGLFPVANMGCSIDPGDNNKLHFEFEYNPAGGLLADKLFTSSGNPIAFVMDNAIIKGGLPEGTSGTQNGFFYKVGTTNTLVNSGLSTSDGVNQWLPLSTAQKINGNMYGVIEFQTGKDTLVGTLTGQTEYRFALGPRTDPNNLLQSPACSIDTATDGEISIKELNNAGTLTEIANAGQTYAPGDRFRILIPPQGSIPPATQSQDIIYQKDTLGNGTYVDLVLTGAAERHHFNDHEKVYPAFGIKSPKVVNKVRRTNTAFAETGLITASTLNTGGTNYLEGETCIIKNDGGAANTSGRLIVDSVDANGTITAFTISNGGTAYNGGTTYIIEGMASGSSDGRLDVTTALDLLNVNSAGLGYAVAEVLTDTGTSGITLEVVTASGAGAITEVKVTNSGDGSYTGGLLTFSDSIGNPGNPFICGFRALESQQPYLTNVAVASLLKNPTLTPAGNLSVHREQSFRASVGLANLLNLNRNAYTNNGDEMDFTSNTDIAPNNRTANNMLVHLDNFPLTSIHKNGNGRAVWCGPFGDNTNSHTGIFHKDSNWLLYHSLENKTEVQNNQINVRITDAEGNLLQGIQHPVVLDLDLRPKAM